MDRLGGHGDDLLQTPPIGQVIVVGGDVPVRAAGALFGVAPLPVFHMAVGKRKGASLPVAVGRQIDRARVRLSKSTNEVSLQDSRLVGVEESRLAVGREEGMDMGLFFA